MYPNDGQGPLRLKMIDETWYTWNGIHGGYALALAAQLAQTEQTPCLRALQGVFLAPIPAGTALRAQVSDLRMGRSGSDVHIQVSANGVTALQAVATFDRLRTGVSIERAPAPSVARPEDCPVFALPVEVVPFNSHIEVRPASDALPLGGGPDPELVAWIRLVDADLEPWQVITVLLDALPPALFAIATVPAAIPTTTLSITLTDAAHRCNSEDWALVRICTDIAVEGWAVESSTVWDRHGVLLGHASQQRKVLSALH